MIGLPLLGGTVTDFLPFRRENAPGTIFVGKNVAISLSVFGPFLTRQRPDIG